MEPIGDHAANDEEGKGGGLQNVHSGLHLEIARTGRSVRTGFLAFGVAKAWERSSMLDLGQSENYGSGSPNHQTRTVMRSPEVLEDLFPTEKVARPPAI